MFKNFFILMLMLILLMMGSVSFADHVTADSQSGDIVTKYRVELNGEIEPADIETAGPDQVQLYYNIDHLPDGRHDIAASAGNDEGEWSDWSDSIAFYRGVPTPENIYLYCGMEEEPTRLSQDGWVIAGVSSEDGVKYARLVIDGNVGTYWRSDTGHPHEIQIDLGATYVISGVYCTARQDERWNGTIQEYALFISMDGTNWTEVSTGELEKTREEQLVKFAAQGARYVGLVALSEVDGGLRAVISELNILGKE